MQKFTAHMTYSKATIQRMGTVQVYARTLHNMIYILMCIALIAAGLGFGTGSALGMTCLILGCVGLPFLGAMIKTRTTNLAERMGDKKLAADYTFYDKTFSVTSEGKVNNFQYDKLTRLLEDEGYCYLFFGKTNTFMFQKKSLQPGDLDAFKKALAAETGLRWSVPSPAAALNLQQIIGDLKVAFRKRMK